MKGTTYWTIGLLIFLTTISRFDSALLPLSSPTEISNITSFIKTVLLNNPKRLVVLLKQDTADNLLYKQICELVNNLTIPSFNMQERLIGMFNGPFDKKFSYPAITDESRMYLVFIKNVSSGVNILPTIRRIHFFRPRHNIILLTDLYSNISVDLVIDINVLFRHYWQKEILNIALILNSENIYTHQPYFNNFVVRIVGQNIFPDKTRNLNGHRLRMSMFKAALDAIELHSGKVIGRDLDQWSTIAQELNASFVLIPPTDGITYGLKFPNGSMTGVFADVVQNITDLAVNSRMVKLQFENLLTSTYPHDREDVSIIVPTAENIKEFVKFVMLFSTNLWILVGCLAVVFALFWWKFFVPNHPVYAFLSSYTLSLGNPVSEPVGTIPRMILLIYTSWIFFIQGAYHGTLTSVLTVPLFAPEINTLNQLENSKIDMYAANRFKDMFLVNLGGTLTSKLVGKIKTVPDDPDIEKLVSRRGHYAIIQKETFALHAVYQRGNYKKDGSQIYRMMLEKPMPTQVCYAARYGYPLLPKLNQFLRRFQEAGLDKHWKQITIHRLMLDEKYGEIPAPPSLRVLSFDNISIAFIALAFGLSLAFAIILIENCIDYCKHI